MRSRDRRLGMDRDISRRDFLNGVSLVAGSALVPGRSMRDGLPGADELPLAGSQLDSEYYPPALTGLRGSHDGSWEVAHRLRDAGSWDDAAGETDTGETYDLVVVGGGLSGLAAAFFYRQATGPDTKILVLDNHDDFGGHAKRNEFHHDGKVIIGYGGTQSIEAPSTYSPQSLGLLRDLGIDLDRFYTAFDHDLYGSLGLGSAVFFDRAAYGADRLVRETDDQSMAEFMAASPMSVEGQRDIARLYEDARDYMPGLSSDEKKARLARMSYRSYLADVVGLGEDAQQYFDFVCLAGGLFCTGADAVPALYLWQMGYPGFEGMGLAPTTEDQLENLPGVGHGRRVEPDDPYIFHFPDGNAGIARLIVRDLIPDALPGSSMEDVVTARLDYSRLDRAGAAARIRLNSTAVHVAHDGDVGSADEVRIAYVRDGSAEVVRARHCVLACWNRVIPYLCPELPEAQAEALAYGVKAPLVYTNVLIRDWTSFERLGVSDIRSFGSFFTNIGLDYPVSLGTYRHSSSPQDPVVLHLSKTPARPGLSKRDQHRAGKEELLMTTFETFERNIRDQLDRTLADGGFDAARDIVGITVNRWPHGYAYHYNSLYDPVEWAFSDTDERPCVVGRQPIGRISIANSDAAASSHSDAAFDEAHRAVSEITGH